MIAEARERSCTLLENARRRVYRKTDRMFGVLMVVQVVAGVVAALVISPRTWAGAGSQVHLHVWASIGIGVALASLPLFLVWRCSGERVTRYVIACAQMGFSALFIHITGGRIETHFHVFGSLAFLAFYRDWTVLVPATLVVAADHLLRGVFWPESVFGVLAAAPWRAAEHAGWVLFEDAFLVYSCVASDRELRAVCDARATLEHSKRGTEQAVLVRTAQLRDALAAQKASEERYSLAIRGSGDALWDWDLLEGRVHYAPAWAELFGLSPESVTDSPEEWFRRVAPDALGDFRKELAEYLRSGSSRFDIEVETRRADGRACWVLCRAVATRDAAGHATRLAGSLADITELKAAQLALDRQAHHDRLTDLPNRARLRERLAEAMSVATEQPGHNYALLFFDFDRFKVVNDSLGHNIGDALLRSIADRFRRVLRQHDTAARFGGDEFVVLLRRIESQAEAEAACGRYLAEFARPHEIEGHSIVSTASIGLVIGDPDYSSPDEVIRDADAAMYKAKNAGRGGFRTFDREMRAEALERLRVEHDLRLALERGEIRVHYQPVVCLRSGRVAALEALVRWQHPERGLVMPDGFVGVAEDSGLIAPLGDWVLEHSCRSLAAWRRAPGASPNLGVNVNVSRRQLVAPGFVGRVRELLEETGIAPATLKLEITESTVMDRGGEALRAMRALRELGVKLAMDDFGTGHSSLSCLHQFPIDVLKIDRSFVENLEERRAFSAIVNAIISLACQLGLDVVAEGIETESQLAQLQGMSCTFGQGHLFARALPEEDVEAYLRRGPVGRAAA